MSNITMREMLEAGVHFGHQTRYWNPKMAPFIFTEKIEKMSDSLTLNNTRSTAVRLWLPNYGESSRPTVVAGICLRCVGLELFSTPEISSDGDDYRAVNNNK